MPKKHQQNFSKPSSNYVHPSLASSRPPSTANAGPSATHSVNDRLNQLRREQAPKAGIERRNEFAESLIPRAVHPAVRQILNLPEPAPPRPHVVPRAANGRRVPGPAAPQSWLETSRHVPEYVRQEHGLKALGPWRLVRASFPERMPSEGSLVHYTLKTLAANWAWLLEYEQHYLATLPIPLKDVLLSYLAVYGPDHAITPATLRILFLNENELDGATGSDELKHLDLTGLIGGGISLADLIRFMTQASASKKDDLVAAVDRMTVSEDVADSWEDAAEAEVPTLPKQPVNVRFPGLTHLSLAHPQSASWSQLLSLSTHLKTLTHLSLAFWPTPSMTPNAKAASMTSKHGRVNLGGIHFYSDMDNDWQEAANILRRLAKNTYCLRWLDVSGCDWVPALTWGVPGENQWIFEMRDGTRRTSISSGQEVVDDSWDISQAAPGPDWNGSWRQMTHVNISQGWIPNDVSAIRALPAGLMGCELLQFLRSDEAKRLPESPLGKVPQSGGQVRKWIEREMIHRRVAETIRALRIAAKGSYCNFDHGWTPARTRQLHKDG